ncbi:hypothetical protein JWG42_16685 [Desulfoprunum benzoelyticum]|uniref:FecR protein domain-containing protein n=1 Tax=Desulfoprunum benzoelyticum TaxID=1506996 RepID=A0A840V4S2_9BACT|nr:hypothetical protein [Desulfoprunum benzoelyticum]MBB5348091.1 hypothetical protein [Desulfoprunum benzoelyticum]MBM9531797.1 hypothetical protein [Desulfoprunum benzoelyticum]
MHKSLKSIALCLAVAFSLSSTVSFANQGGSIGQGNISVLKDDQVVDTLKGQSPIDESSMLVCDGKCMIKSAGISLVAADQAKFAIKNEAETFRLFLQSGSVDYVITENARKIAFHTPEGVYSIAEVIFNAASDPVVKGSVAVTKDGKTEVSVTEGRLMFATADGMKTVNANEKIVLAISTPPPAAPAGDSPKNDDNDRKKGAYWFAGTVAAGALLIALADDNDSDGPGAGPAAGPGAGPAPSPKPSPGPKPTPPASPST